MMVVYIYFFLIKLQNGLKDLDSFYFKFKNLLFADKMQIYLSNLKQVMPVGNSVLTLDMFSQTFINALII